jgi:2-hydroxy-3-keto-5-methylthiopentenyl-1-phosphate phosphatase
MNRTYRLFLDFDGTMTAEDVGNRFFERFGGPVCTELVRRYRAEEISARACFEQEMAAVGALDPAAFTSFLAQQELDPGARELIASCKRMDVEVTILSDGLDAYIRPLLEKLGVEGIRYFSNLAVWQEEGTRMRARLSFPHANGECDRCGCCKRNIMLGSAGDGDVLIYVGDGYSDRCPVEYADLVFAKGALQTWCQQNNITYLPYRSLEEVHRRLETELGQRTLRPRPRAERKRREAYMMEA